MLSVIPNLAAAIRSHRALAALSAARFGSCVGNCKSLRITTRREKISFNQIKAIRKEGMVALGVVFTSREHVIALDRAVRAFSA